MKTDELGIPRFTNKDLVDMIYSGHVDKCHVVLCDPSDDIEKFNAAMREQYLPELKQYIPLDVDQKTFDGALQSEWFMPDEYKDINVYEYVLGKAETPCPQHVLWNAEPRLARANDFANRQLQTGTRITLCCC